MGNFYAKCCDACCPDPPGEQIAEDYMKRHGIFDVPDTVSKTIQWILLIATALEFIIAVGALIFGVYGLEVRSEFGVPAGLNDEFIDALVNLPVVLIVLGAFSVILCFIGALGAIREYIPLLAVYLTFLLLLTVAHFFVGIYFLARKDTIMARFDNYFASKAVRNYYDDVDLKNIIDYVQQGFECCGSNSYTDWNKNQYFNCSTANPSLSKCSVPPSCCIAAASVGDGTDASLVLLNQFCGQGALDPSKSATEVSKLIFTDGCFGQVRDRLNKYTAAIAVAILVIVVSPIIQEVCIGILIYDVNAERMAFEMWQDTEGGGSGVGPGGDQAGVDTSDIQMKPVGSTTPFLAPVTEQPGETAIA